ncbi:MAG: hypothetical protein PHO20_01530 [Candidatus Peribacteraceae bacterium]|nr:hypothetical protein [Candidatus Peribacteraceae bacterium]MDD5739430.1 hypothetical protein [Candidatus Peribacteraceae bacterium]
MKSAESQRQLTDSFDPHGHDFQDFVVEGYNSHCRFNTKIECHRATVRRQGEQLLLLLAHHGHMQYVKKPDGKLGEQEACDACQAQWKEADRKLDPEN